MKRVVDTSAWVEWIAGKMPVLAREMPSGADCLVPTIVQLELAKWAAREGGDEAVDLIIGLTTQCTVVALDPRIALSAAELGRRHKLPTADSIVYASAIAMRSDLLTCDAHFKNLPHVIYHPKHGA